MKLACVLRESVGRVPGRRTVHTRAASHALSAGYDGSAATQSFAGMCDVKFDGRTIRAEMVEIAAGLGMQVIIARGRASFYDEDAEGGVSVGETACDDTTTGAA